MDRKSIFVVAASLCIAVVAFYGGRQAGQSTAFDIEKQISERVIKLPEDGHAYHVTVVVNPNWQNTPSARLVNYFDTDPRLMGLKSQTHFHVYQTNSAMYRERYGASWGYAAPMVVVQRGDGQCVYVARMNNIPPTSTELADEIRSSMQIFAKKMEGWGGGGLPGGANKLMYEKTKEKDIRNQDAPDSSTKGLGPRDMPPNLKGKADQFSVIGGQRPATVDDKGRHPFRPWLDQNGGNCPGPNCTPQPNVTPVTPEWTPPWSDPNQRVDGQPVIPDMKSVPQDQMVGLAVIAALVGFFYWKKQQQKA